MAEFQQLLQCSSLNMVLLMFDKSKCLQWNVTPHFPLLVSGLQTHSTVGLVLPKYSMCMNSSSLFCAALHYISDVHFRSPYTHLMYIYIVYVYVDFKQVRKCDVVLLGVMRYRLRHHSYSTPFSLKTINVRLILP